MSPSSKEFVPAPDGAAMPSADRGRSRRWLVALSVSIGTIMGALDSSIVSVAIPDMRGSFGATVESMTWITTGYVMAAVIMMPLTGFLGRLFGQKRTYLAALSLFVLSSVLCAFSPNLLALVVFRALQGAGAGALQPLEQTILRQTFSSPKEQGTATAIFGLAVAAGPAAGPTLGGLILEHTHWPWIFLINAPIGLAGILLVRRFVQELPDASAAHGPPGRTGAPRAKLDWQGIMLMALGLASLEYVLEEGSAKDWFESWLILTASAVALLALLAFVLRARSIKAPAVAIHLFALPTFCAGTLIGGCTFAVLLAITFLVPVFIRETLHFTPLQAGLAVMPRALAMMVTMPLIGRLSRTISARWIVAAGIVAVVISTFRMSQYDLNTDARSIAGDLVVSGVGFACLFVCLTTVAMSGVPKQQLADAAGLNSLVRQLGGSLGLSLVATLLPRATEQAFAGLMSQLVAGRLEIVERLSILRRGALLHDLDPAVAGLVASSQLLQSVRRQAAVLGFNQLLLLAGISFLCVLPLIWLIRTPAATTR